MTTKTFIYTITSAAVLGLANLAAADSGSTASTPPPTAAGDAAQSKSGAGPGSTGNSAPDASPGH